MIDCNARFRGPLHYASFEELKEEFRAKKVHPMDLKASMMSEINCLLEKIQKGIEGDKEWKQIEALAYPEVGRL
jgi:tyrosyl-tRNA synthetase